MTSDEQNEFDQLLDQAQSELAAGKFKEQFGAGVKAAIENEQAMLKRKQADMRLLNDLTVSATEAKLPKPTKRNPGGMDPSRFQKLLVNQQGMERAMEADWSRAIENLQENGAVHGRVGARIAATLADANRRMREVEQFLQRSMD